MDARGGWHDAGDQLKYLITASNATARMITAYKLFPNRFSGHVNALGQEEPNGIPDILDEARWGLDWIHTLHPQEGQLFHQVGDDRDHVGWKLPSYDPSDYGWGKNSYRVAYIMPLYGMGCNIFCNLSTYDNKGTEIGNSEIA